MARLSIKSQLIQLMWLTWSFSLLGLDNGILGPTLLDLASNIGTLPKNLNIVFPAHGLGFFIGITLSSFMVKLNYLHLSIGMSLLLGSVVNILIPISHSLAWLAIFFGLQGTAKGFVDIFVFTLCLRLFPKQHSWQMLLIPISASLSSFLIPFVVQPFLSQWIIKADSNITSISNCTMETCLQTPTQIIIPYSLTAVVLVPPMTAFFVYSASNNCSKTVIDNYDIITEKKTSKFVGWRNSWIMIVLLFLFHIPVFGSVIGYSHLLTLYGTLKPLYLSKSIMTYMTALFWGFMLTGRIFNMILSNFINLEILLRINFAGLFIFASILLIHQVEEIESLLWLGTSGYGFFQSSFLPSVIAWVSTFMELDVVILSTSLVANALGELLVPYVEALTFTDDGQNYLMYFVFAVSVMEICLFICMSVYKHYK